MIKDGTFEAHKEDMQKAFASGAVRDITTKEIEQWCGPVHFLTLSRLFLNNCFWAGPNPMAELPVDLVHWRTVDVALITDSIKAYHVI